MRKLAQPLTIKSSTEGQLMGNLQGHVHKKGRVQIKNIL